MKKQHPLYCPIPDVIDELPFNYGEIEPLLAFLSSNEKIEKEAIFQRGTITNIGQLDCCKQDLGAAGAALLSDALKNNQHIKSILLGTGGIGNEGAKSVSELIEHNQIIETVYLGCNQIKEEGLSYLTNVLKSNPTIHSLWLKRNPIGKTGAFKIAELLAVNPRIRTLDLVNTLIESEGLQAILEVLIHKNYPIKRLYLGGNQLLSTNGSALKQLILKNQHLEELLLSVNDLGEVGAMQIAEGISRNTTLKSLSLASNNISSQGAAAIFKAAERHPNLKTLDLGYARSSKVLGASMNLIDDETAFAIQSFLENNQSLRFLNLNRNLLTLNGLQRIENGLSQNRFLQKLTLGKGFQKRTKQGIADLLARNRIENPFEFEVSNDVKVIRSRYR